MLFSLWFNLSGFKLVFSIFSFLPAFLQPVSLPLMSAQNGFTIGARQPRLQQSFLLPSLVCLGGLQEDKSRWYTETGIVNVQFSIVLASSEVFNLKLLAVFGLLNLPNTVATQLQGPPPFKSATSLKLIKKHFKNCSESWWMTFTSNFPENVFTAILSKVDHFHNQFKNTIIIIWLAY